MFIGKITRTEQSVASLQQKSTFEHKKKTTCKKKPIAFLKWSFRRRIRGNCLIFQSLVGVFAQTF